MRLRCNQYCPNPRITLLLVVRSPSGRERLIIRRIGVHQEMFASVPQALAPLYRQTHAYAVNQIGLCPGRANNLDIHHFSPVLQRI